MTDSAVTPFGIKVVTDLLVGAIIRAKTNGDAAKQSARATEIIAINAALSKLNDGDVTGGLAAIEASVNTTALDPSEAAAVLNTVSFISTKAAAIQQLESGTAIGAQVTAILGQVLDEGTAVAQKYLPKA